MLTASRPDVVHKIFERQVEVGIANLEKIHGRIGDAIDVLFLCGTDFGTQTSSFCSVKTFDALMEAALRRALRLDPQEHDLEDFQALLRLVRAVLRIDDRCGHRHHQSGAVLGQGHGPEDAEGEVQRAVSSSGAAASTRSRRLPFGTPAEVRRRCLERCEIFSDGGGFVFEFDPQRPGRHADREHGRDVRRGEGV